MIHNTLSGVIHNAPYKASRLYLKVNDKLSSKPKSFVHTYWENRYSAGGNSGVGSYNDFANFKASVLNEVISEREIRSVIEFGCGDGNQASLIDCECYTGYDLSPTAIAVCRKRFKGNCSRSFHLLSEYNGQTADMTISLDVVYHLVDDDIFSSHLQTLFGAAKSVVVIYSSNTNENPEKKSVPHVKHRRFTDWVERNIPNWTLHQVIPNKYPYQGDVRTGSFCDFYIYVSRPKIQ